MIVGFWNTNFCHKIKNKTRLYRIQHSTNEDKSVYNVYGGGGGARENPTGSYSC